MKPASNNGFTLIELMVTIAIVAILIVLGFPSYSQWMRNNRIRNTADSIQNGLRLARSEASQSGANVRFELTSTASPATANWTVCILPTGITTCAGGGTTVQNFVAAGGAGDVQITASSNIADTNTYSSALSGGVPAGITFDALGRPSDYGNNSVLRIDANSPGAGSRRMVTTISAGGMVRTCDSQLSLSTSPQGCM